MMNWQQQIQDRCQKDAKFCAQLMSDPQQACKSAGISMPSGCTVQCHQDSDQCMNVVLQDACCCSPQAFKVAQKACSDPQFKSQLMSNPQAACQSVLGSQMSSGMQVRVYESSEQCCHIVMPAKGTYSVQVRK